MSHSDDDLPLGRIILWTVLCAVALVALWIGIAGAVLGFNVATAGIVGKSQETIQIQSAANRIAQQERFATLYNDIQAQSNQIPNTRTALAAATTNDDRSRLATVLLGQQNLCDQNVANYNALTEKVTAEDFKDQSFPASINPAQYCK
jgi:hypothetical protein